MKKLWWKKRPASELDDTPYLHPDVVEFMDEIISPDFEIMEHGSGGSTLWFAQRCKSVLAVERNEEWNKAVRRKAPNNVTVIKGDDIQPGEYDLILIDGEPLCNRVQWAAQAPQRLKPGGWIVFDNCNHEQF